MSSEPLPPPAPSDDAIRGLLEQRVKRCGLSPGMVAGVTQGGQRSVVAHGAADAAAGALDGDTVFEIGCHAPGRPPAGPDHRPGSAPGFPLSEWRFFYKAVGAQITFEPCPDGRAARLILHQNSRDQGADRIGDGS